MRFLVFRAKNIFIFKEKKQKTLFSKETIEQTKNEIKMESNPNKNRDKRNETKPNHVLLLLRGTIVNRTKYC